MIAPALVTMRPNFNPFRVVEGYGSREKILFATDSKAEALTWRNTYRPECSVVRKSIRDVSSMTISSGEVR